MQPLGFGWWVAILIYVRGCNGTNDCRRVRVRVRVTCRVSASRVSRGRCRYAAVCGLRHLLHGLTVFGVAAAHLADLQAREAHLFDEYLKLQAALERAKNAMATARTTLRQLRARLHALPPANPGEAKLIDEIAAAEGVINDASADVKGCRRAVEFNRKELEHVRSQIDAMEGALLA